MVARRNRGRWVNSWGEAIRQGPVLQAFHSLPSVTLCALLTHPQEFENAEGDEYVAEFSEQGSPAAAAQTGPDVYVLPLTEVSLPMAKQPGRSGT